MNIPLIVLWVVSVGVAVFGYFYLQGGIAGQAEFYKGDRSDYLTIISLQTQTTIGGLLLIAGLVGVLLAFATHARNWAAAADAAAMRAVYADLVERDLDGDDDDGDAGVAGLETGPQESPVEETGSERPATDAPGSEGGTR